MRYNVDIDENYDLPVLAGIFRVLMGLTALFVGLFIALFSDVQGHGLGLLLVFGSPFVLLKDNK